MVAAPWYDLSAHVAYFCSSGGSGSPPRLPCHEWDQQRAAVGGEVSYAAFVHFAKGGASVSRLTLHYRRRYRPSTLDELVAHDEIIGILTRLIESGKLPHLLFYGPPGTGKVSIETRGAPVAAVWPQCVRAPFDCELRCRYRCLRGLHLPCIARFPRLSLDPRHRQSWPRRGPCTALGAGP